MKDIILRLSIVIFLISLFILFLLMNSIKPQLSTINELKTYEVFKDIKIKVNVTKIKNYDDFTIIQVKDNTGNINIFTDIKNLNVSKNNILLITGKISKYYENIQINAQIIEVLS